MSFLLCYSDNSSFLKKEKLSMPATVHIAELLIKTQRASSVDQDVTLLLDIRPKNRAGL